MVPDDEPVVTNVAEAAELRLLIGKVTDSCGTYAATGFRRFKQIVRLVLLPCCYEAALRKQLPV